MAVTEVGMTKMRHLQGVDMTVSHLGTKDLTRHMHAVRLARRRPALVSLQLRAHGGLWREHAVGADK